MKMKKAAALVLGTAMVMGMSTNVFAADDPTKDVIGTYAASGATPVYSIEYAWGDMEFTYAPSDKGTWDPETHTYSGGSDAGVWSSSGTDITVTNHSNAEIDVTLSYKQAAGYESATLGFTEPTFTVATAEGTAVNEAPSKTVQAGMTEGSTLPEGTDKAVIGTITLSVK